MDEPLASLDDARKAEILPYVERMRDALAIPIVYVSHSVVEVARLASDIVVMADGKVSAAGRTSDILQRLDLLPMEERGEGGSILDMVVAGRPDEFGTTLLRSPLGELRVTGHDGEPGSPVRLRIRARDVMIATERPQGLSALNVLPAVVGSISDAKGAVCDVLLDCNGQTIAARITLRSRHDLALSPGTPVFAVIKSVSIDQAYASRPIRIDAL
jgi:molybdate transport system ATP-binding protein